MANTGPNTNSSQFFITLATVSWLDGGHAIMFIVHCVAALDEQSLPQYTFTVCNTGEGVNYHAAIGHNIGERDRMSVYTSPLPHHRNALAHAHNL